MGEEWYKELLLITQKVDRKIFRVSIVERDT